MGKKFYTQTDAGVSFKSERRPGDVRIPNYIYDMWLPLLGSDTIGVYSVYCRLEREGVVKQLTMQRLARTCRIGKSKLARINDELAHCEFIRIVKPTGKKRLMHWTTEIIILDPPQFVSQELIDEFALKTGYEVLTPWLMKDEAGLPEDPFGSSDIPDQVSHEDPNGFPSIESLGLNPLGIEEEPQTSQSVDYLEDIFTRTVSNDSDGSGVADPSQDDDQWLAFRDPAIQMVSDITGRAPNPTQQGMISNLAGEHAFSLILWEESIRSCEASNVRAGNVACYIDTYRSGGNYGEMCEAKRRGEDLIQQKPVIEEIPRDQFEMPEFMKG